jgi:hypothetical protein
MGSVKCCDNCLFHTFVCEDGNCENTCSKVVNPCIHNENEDCELFETM